MASSKLNIYQKLIEVRKTVPYLKKDNSGYQFKYVSSSQTLGTLRGKMDELGLLLVPKVVEESVEDHKTSKGDHQYFTRLRMVFTWVNSENPEEKIECPWTGQGLDSGEKGVGKAVTYAEKYFMLKFFNIATDQDDPDSFQKKFESGGNSKNKTEPSKVELMFNKWYEWIEATGKKSKTADDFDTAIAGVSVPLAQFKGKYKSDINKLIEDTKKYIEERG